MYYLDIVDTKTHDGVLMRDSEDDHVVARGALVPIGAVPIGPQVHFEFPVKFVGVSVPSSAGERSAHPLFTQESIAKAERE